MSTRSTNRLPDAPSVPPLVFRRHTASGRFFGRGRLDVRAVGRRRLRGVGGGLAESVFEFGDAGGESDDLVGDPFEGAEVGDRGRAQGGEEFVGQRRRCRATATLPANPRERKGRASRPAKRVRLE